MGLSLVNLQSCCTGRFERAQEFSASVQARFVLEGLASASPGVPSAHGIPSPDRVPFHSTYFELNRTEETSRCLAPGHACDLLIGRSLSFQACQPCCRFESMAEALMVREPMKLRRRRVRKSPSWMRRRHRPRKSCWMFGH